MGTENDGGVCVRALFLMKLLAREDAFEKVTPEKSLKEKRI